MSPLLHKNKKMDYKIKIVAGYRKDQQHSIPAEEAHKAYYLFLNPSKRGIFSNGLGLVGKNIQEILPDYNGTMGWNETHTLTSDDMNELRKQGIDRKLREIMTTAQKIGAIGEPQSLALPLSKVAQLTLE